MNVTATQFRYRGKDKFAFLLELQIWVNLYPHRSDLPLIADKLKPLFGCRSNGIFAIILNGRKHLAIRSLCDSLGYPVMLSSMRYLSKDYHEEIYQQMRSILVFRYVLDLRSMIMEEIRILPTKPLTLISTCEKTSGYDSVSAVGKLSASMMDTWFYNWSMKDTFAKLIPPDMPVDQFLAKFVLSLDFILSQFTVPVGDIRHTIINRATRLAMSVK